MLLNIGGIVLIVVYLLLCWLYCVDCCICVVNVACKTACKSPASIQVTDSRIGDGGVSQQVCFRIF